MLSREDIAFMYLEQLPFEPYPFQEEAVFGWFSSEQGALVCAPTGMGKTLIAEAGIFEAIKTGKKAYYTTPLIALTEQKYREIQAALERWGYNKHYVGLVTGNRRENPDAPILVVVAEILFNRLLAAQNQANMFHFDDVTTVVMDEFHNFADAERGMVWEFTLNLLPQHIRTLLISATVGNAYEFVAWLRDNVQRRLTLVESFERKVPLTYQWIGDQLLTEHLEFMTRGDEESRLTPALVFCFDRNECWNIADQVRGRDLITAERQKTISQILEQYDWKEGAGPHLKQLLLRGVGIHHAGVLPKYRRIVEDLFQQKLLSICVCTETLAAGINLPARSVVLPSILKGKPGEKKIIESSSAHQIFGRAGRPQYDDHGFVFVLAHEDDVKIGRWKAKYDQIPEDTKDPKLREMKKKMKKKAPSRRTTEQYWTEDQFLKLKEMPPGKLASRGVIPWRLLAHIISLDHNIEPIRQIVGRRLMSEKWVREGQKKLDEMLLILSDAGFIRLEKKDGNENTETMNKNTAEQKEVTEPNSLEVRKVDFNFAYPTERLSELMKFRGVHPLYGMFLLQHLGIADRAERIQAFESLLELPPSIGPSVRVPKQDVLPNGTLSTERLDSMLLSLGLAVTDELVPKTEEEEEDEREKRRHFGGWAEERFYVIPLAEKLRRLFEYEYPTVEVRINPVWAAGEILLEFKGDFNKYVVSRAIQKQEGVIFRHLLRLILLLEEFSEMTPVDCSPADWKADLTDMAETLIACCTKVDPQSTEETLEHAKETAIDEAM
ncbi:MAG: DEAD/DEAH box helicase [Planctomycetaceae bacterium]|jgi:superfamily II DNA/RNA helicase|nr:DEAD/DEAH box helicase [Planctomycetaceae bacterium]